jgi:hypothetical protein
MTDYSKNENVNVSVGFRVCSRYCDLKSIWGVVIIYQLSHSLRYIVLKTNNVLGMYLYLLCSVFESLWDIGNFMCCCYFFRRSYYTHLLLLLSRIFCGFSQCLVQMLAFLKCHLLGIFIFAKPRTILSV